MNNKLISLLLSLLVHILYDKRVAPDKTSHTNIYYIQSNEMQENIDEIYNSYFKKSCISQSWKYKK